ncbi:MAG: 30S ribosomal protein S6 [Helicobacteraceae bacterium]|jgi:small subunit ribosomal protein S6|nr:30S ribosomal protein S6 [Helicobacteraceae bacterium]
MSKRYETAFILKPTLAEEEANAKIEFFSELIAKNGGEIVAVERLGVKKLAYKIKKFERGFYAVIYFTSDGGVNKELERVYGITEDILRFIVIKYETKVEIDAWENMVNRAKGLPFKEYRLSETVREYRPRPQRAPRAPRGEEGGERRERQPRGEEIAEEAVAADANEEIKGVE